MFTVFKWFFGAIAIIIMFYVLFVLLKTFFGLDFTGGTTGTSTAGTEVKQAIGVGANTLAYKITHFNLNDWAKNFHPFTYAPISVAPYNSESSAGSGRYRWYYGGVGFGDADNSTSFDQRWKGGGYFGSDEPTPEPVDLRDNKYTNYQMPAMIFKSPNNCVITGCSQEFCIEKEAAQNLVSTCEYRAAYACFKRAVCEKNRQTGRCGWRLDNTLVSCLQNSN